MNTCPNCGKIAGLHSSILQGCMCQYSTKALPQREWQGLTDEEIQDMWSDHCRNWQRLGKVLISPTVFGQAIEAKLKQKNYQSALHNMNKAAEKNGEEL